MSRDWNSEDAWNLADIIGKSYAVIAGIADYIARNEGVSRSKIVALAVLNAYPDGLSQTEWGRYQGVSRQRVGIITKELTAEQIITCIPTGRSSLVQLTKKGKRCILQYKKIFGSALQPHLKQFSKEDGETLTNLLQNLVCSLENDSKR